MYEVEQYGTRKICLRYSEQGLRERERELLQKVDLSAVKWLMRYVEGMWVGGVNKQEKRSLKHV